MTTAVAERAGTTGALTEALEGEFAQLRLSELVESPLNPRKHFDEKELKQLSDNIAKVGVLDSLLVRPIAGGRYEIASGHRRFRAAKMAGIATVPCRVRAMSETLFLEVLTVANLQRTDLDPLEEARGFAQLMKKGIGYDVRKIADRVGRSIEYVYARLKLLQLIPEIAAFLESKRITAGHAIELARLSAEDQHKAIKLSRPGSYGSDGGLWRRAAEADGLFAVDAPALDGEDVLPYTAHGQAVTPVSVRELRSWIDDHVRFDRAAPDPVLFPETAAALKTATEKGEKIVAITFEHQLDASRKDDEDKTYTCRSWKRADGQLWRDPTKLSRKPEKSKTCDRSVLGVVSIGEGRTDTFRVCVSRGCSVHWPEKKAKKPSSGSPSSAATKAAAEQARYLEQRRKREEQEKKEREAYEKAVPKMLEILAAKLKAAPASAGSPLATLILRRYAARGLTLVPRGKTAEDFLRHIGFLAIAEYARNWYHGDDFIRQCAAVGADVKVALKPEKATAPAKTKKPAKKARK